jgi:hypothetical protein
MTKARLVDVILSSDWIMSDAAEERAMTDDALATVQSNYGTRRIMRCRKDDLEHVAALVLIAKADEQIEAAKAVETMDSNQNERTNEMNYNEMSREEKRTEVERLTIKLQIANGWNRLKAYDHAISMVYGW